MEEFIYNIIEHPLLPLAVIIFGGLYIYQRLICSYKDKLFKRNEAYSTLKKQGLKMLELDNKFRGIFQVEGFYLDSRFSFKTQLSDESKEGALSYIKDLICDSEKFFQEKHEANINVLPRSIRKRAGNAHYKGFQAVLDYVKKLEVIYTQIEKDNKKFDINKYSPEGKFFDVLHRDEIKVSSNGYNLIKLANKGLI